ncbi:hypothetical protein HHK36_008043 [Tetracentron sinense]|uniref:SAP domain-containing protein n=1 Tax=Tetracentron sinense TaxID=13715 RepID=A0A835DIX4_TETSI|nr:hypothetical protein HHK36_008043 [Tetracentron sinense]
MMSTRYPILDNRPIDQWKVAELKEELRRRKLTTRGLKDDLIKRLDEAIHNERAAANEEVDNGFDCDSTPEAKFKDAEMKLIDTETVINTRDHGENNTGKVDDDATVVDIDDTEMVKDTRDHAENKTGKVDDEAAVVDIDDTEMVKDSRDHGENETGKVDEDATVVGIDDSPTELGQVKGEVGDVLVMASTESVVVVGEQAVLEVSVENISTVSQSMVTQIATSGNESQNNETQMEIEDSNPLPKDAVLNVSNPNYQVSEVRPILGFQVLSESVSTDSVSINEKNELKDNLNADNVHLELEVVKPEMVQPSSSDVPPNGGDFHPMDYQEPCEIQGSVEETCDNNATIVDLNKKNDSADGESLEKLNLDRSSGDDSMEEDILENKQIDLNHNSNEVGDMIQLNEVLVVKEEGAADPTGADVSSDKKEIPAENKNSLAPPAEKRKLQVYMVVFLKNEWCSKALGLPLCARSTIKGIWDLVTERMQRRLVGWKKCFLSKCGSYLLHKEDAELVNEAAVGDNEPPKRQRRWGSESLKVPELQSSNLSPVATPKDVFQPTISKRNFTRSDSTLSGDEPKERVVPPSPKPPTSSLRIDRFLRPFTLKAVEELLGKTGNVCSFWMDHIKTHCYVTYSSMEEAIETRNAVYNLQWPPNGGRLLVAEFVDPQEVKIRAEAPQLPTPPVNTSPTVPPRQSPFQPQPSPRQQVLRQQLPPPPPLPLPPPPPLSEPPMARERLPLPPPPPLPEKMDPPIVTLDDLFRKTKATPRIYYLPLSDEQIAAKLAVRGKNTKQSAGVILYAGSDLPKIVQKDLGFWSTGFLYCNLG